MKILMLNKYFYLRGGSERYFFELIQLLESHGHTVIPFAMQTGRDVPSPYAKYFVPNVEYNGSLSAKQKLLAAGRTIYYPLARRNMERLIAEVKPDIVHAHNIYHQLSYSPLHAARRHGIPVVLTTHDYKLVCPNNAFLRGDAVCEKCRGRRFTEAFRGRCSKGSRANSLVLSLEAFFNRRLCDVMRCIDTVVTPSRFMRDKFIEHGLPAAKVIHHFNTLDLRNYPPRFGGDGYALYLGRLAPEKGAATLVRAMRSVPEVPLKILGEGEQKDELQRAVADASMRNVEFLGYRSGTELIDTIRNASLVVVPSEWYENLPYSVLESFALGKPVIGARIGGIPELVEDGVNGYLFESGNADELAAKIRLLAADPDRIAQFGRTAHAKIEKQCDLEEHYHFIIGLYESLVQEKGRRNSPERPKEPSHTSLGRSPR